MAMSEPKDRLEEYVDGLLTEAECLEVEAALARDPALRGEMAEVRRFGALLRELRDPAAEERAVRRILAAAGRSGPARRLLLGSLAAALLLAVGLLLLRSAPSAPPATGLDRIEQDWILYGRRLGTIALERRQGRVPRTGLSDLEPPPAKAAGVVFSAALGVLGVDCSREEEERVRALVARYAEKSRLSGEGIGGEADRSALALETFRALRRVAGPETADAFYDVFRPGAAELHLSRRVHPDALAGVAAEAYVNGYREAVGELSRRYGAEGLERVLGGLVPADARRFRRDPTEDGAVRDAVLAIKERLYRAAASSGSDRLYIALP
jgi:hypothetical protein